MGFQEKIGQCFVHQLRDITSLAFTFLPHLRSKKVHATSSPTAIDNHATSSPTAIDNHATSSPTAVDNEGTKVQNPRRLCHVYRPIANIHGNMHTRTNRECTGKFTEIWQRQKL